MLAKLLSWLLGDCAEGVGAFPVFDSSRGGWGV